MESQSDTKQFFTFTDEDKHHLQVLQNDREQLLSPFATKSSSAVRAFEKKYHKDSDLLVSRSQFSVDVDKIVYNPFFNRSADKTQVFSFFQNDDLTRRSLHMLLVSRIARTIGDALGLNVSLIEAIALGHDAGHPPFGHQGEAVLNQLYHESTGKFFQHSVHGVRVLKDIACTNLTLQTYDGILTHCGEMEQQKYETQAPYANFDAFNEAIRKCYESKDYLKQLSPTTLEGCVVKVSDLIAYLGRDRQDAYKIGLVGAREYDDGLLGKSNAEIITRMTTNIIKCSLGKNSIQMDYEVFHAFRRLRKENYERIYFNEMVKQRNDKISPILERLYKRIRDDILHEDKQSPVFSDFVENPLFNLYRNRIGVEFTADDITCDYIASMTDDYAVFVYNHLFPQYASENDALFEPYF